MNGVELLLRQQQIAATFFHMLHVPRRQLSPSPILQPIFITAGATPALVQARTASRDSRRQEHLPSCRVQVTYTTSSAWQRRYDKVHDDRAEGGESKTSRAGPRWRFSPGHSSVGLCFKFSPVSLLVTKLHVELPCSARPTPYITVWGPGRYCL